MSARNDARVLAEFWVASRLGNERLAMQRVAQALASEGLVARQLDRLKTAVSEATLNAIEHGNNCLDPLLVRVRVERRPESICVSITDDGVCPTPASAPAVPDLDLKLAGQQSPRGWGLFLIRRMVDAVRDHYDGSRHTVHLEVRRAQLAAVASASEP